MTSTKRTVLVFFSLALISIPRMALATNGECGDSTPGVSPQVPALASCIAEATRSVLPTEEDQLLEQLMKSIESQARPPLNEAEKETYRVDLVAWIERMKAEVRKGLTPEEEERRTAHKGFFSKSLPPCRDLMAFQKLVRGRVKITDPKGGAETAKKISQDKARFIVLPGVGLSYYPAPDAGPVLHFDLRLGRGTSKSVSLAADFQKLQANQHPALLAFIKTDYLTYQHELSALSHLPAAFQSPMLHTHVVDDEVVSYYRPFAAAGTLKAYSRKEKMDPMAALEFARDLAGQHASLLQGGVLHRDIKGENILVYKVVEGNPPQIKYKVKIDDWDTVIPITETAALTEVMGTPGYIAPELARGYADHAFEEVKKDSAAFLELRKKAESYSLAATLYTLIESQYALPEGRPPSGCKAGKPSKEGDPIPQFEYKGVEELCQVCGFFCGPLGETVIPPAGTLNHVILQALHPDPWMRPSVQQITELLATATPSVKIDDSDLATQRLKSTRRVRGIRGPLPDGSLDDFPPLRRSRSVPFLSPLDKKTLSRSPRTLRRRDSSSGGSPRSPDESLGYSSSASAGSPAKSSPAFTPGTRRRSAERRLRPTQLIEDQAVLPVVQ